MTPDDGERSEAEPRIQPPGTPQPNPSDPADSTGTWAYVSPFATSPESYGPPTTQVPPPPADDRPAAGPEAPFGSANWNMPGGRPDSGQAPMPAAEPIWGAPAGPGGKPHSRWKTWQKVAAGGTLAAVVAIGGVAAVSAANASSDEAATSQAGFAGRTPASGGSGGIGDSGRTGARGGLAGVMELANALHGDFVVSTGSGTQTMRLQSGEITALSGDSLTVKSSDGYTSTYLVGSGVDVSGLATGDSVRLVGTVSGDTVTATSVQSANAATGGDAGQGAIPPGPGQSGQGGMQAPPTP